MPLTALALVSLLLSGPPADRAPTPQDIWLGFLEHLVKTGRQDLAPPGALDALSEDAATRKAAPRVDLQSTDPIRGVLFKVSKDLVNLDALLSESEGKPLEGADREKAAALVEKLRAHDDPYVKAYGELHGARLDLEAGKTDDAARALERLVDSRELLPRREARRLLAQAYRSRGDETLAILELQFFLEDLPAESETDKAWVRDELKKIREAKHDGPLHDSGRSMRSISELMEALEIGDGTQAKERRVEDILEKVVKLLELKGERLGLSMAGQSQGSASARNRGKQGKQQSGRQPGRRPGEGKDGKDKGKDGEGKDSRGAEGSPNESDEVATAEGQASLRDATPEEKEAWGKINDREVSRTLRELWDKIPPAYRVAVIEYFKDVAEEEEGAARE